MRYWSLGAGGAAGRGSGGLPQGPFSTRLRRRAARQEREERRRAGEDAGEQDAAALDRDPERRAG
ncbi:hypothetical protein [Quadrisphaera sp. DSM 44207]|uniref:hypothetical protein n=1 Tax=Quadrisphaera sp. DSM 44207 TaxID=1881057 RepID=UPI00088F9868|nr:hypothetical protein [Quadrisphaera sp. DSM 44207]SDQ63940.1 hypothetical protein SAMN05428996_2194 [Quadrisphaera sp. DSM 44207]